MCNFHIVRYKKLMRSTYCQLYKAINFLFLSHFYQEKGYSLDGRSADASVASKKANALQSAYNH